MYTIFINLLRNELLGPGAEVHYNSACTDHREIVRQRMKQSTNLQGFLVELSHLAETLLNENQQLEKTPQLQDLPPPEYYSHLLVELQAIGWAKVRMLLLTRAS